MFFWAKCLEKFEALDVSEGCDMHGGFSEPDFAKVALHPWDSLPWTDLLGVLGPRCQQCQKTKHGKCKGKASQGSPFIVSIWLMCLEPWSCSMNGSPCWILNTVKLVYHSGMQEPSWAILVALVYFYTSTSGKATVSLASVSFHDLSSQDSQAHFAAYPDSLVDRPACGSQVLTARVVPMQTWWLQGCNHIPWYPNMIWWALPVRKS